MPPPSSFSEAFQPPPSNISTQKELKRGNVLDDEEEEENEEVVCSPKCIYSFIDSSGLESIYK